MLATSLIGWSDICLYKSCEVNHVIAMIGDWRKLVLWSKYQDSRGDL